MYEGDVRQIVYGWYKNTFHLLSLNSPEDPFRKQMQLASTRLFC